MGILIQGNYETPQGFILQSVYVSLHKSIILYDKSRDILIYTYNVYKDLESATNDKRPLESVETVLETTEISNVFAKSERAELLRRAIKAHQPYQSFRQGRSQH